MNKTAVDKATQEYWASYFKEYGDMWVRDIPRRIKAAIGRDVKASIDGNVAPIAYETSKDGILSVEAGFVGKLGGKDAKVLVTAEFNSEGKMRKFEATRVS